MHFIEEDNDRRTGDEIMSHNFSDIERASASQMPLTRVLGGSKPEQTLPL